MDKQPIKSEPRGGFLSRLLRDRRGNTMAIVGASMFPLVGMVGGGFDLSRMYIVKTRLQHACDAGALAGRKAMGGGTWAQASFMPRTQAERFFDANIRANAYGSRNVTKAFAESAGKVTGTASAVLPMTLMRVLGKTTETLTVTCDAEMRLPNTDVMFVLDVTGSMNCRAGDTSCVNNGNVPANDSKIEGLQVAVQCFYEIVARLDTPADCVAGAPSGGTGNSVQIRFGFVPYAANVNVGRLLPSTMFADRWQYQSRERAGSDWGNWQERYTEARPSNGCVANASTGEEQWAVEGYWSWFSGNRCRHYSRGRVTQWRYAAIDTDITGLKNGIGWRENFVVPAINNDGSDRTVTWQGCVEERQTVRTTDFDPIPDDAFDLDIDMLPAAGNRATLWGPALNQIVFNRGTTNEVTTTQAYNNLSIDCPSEGRLLQSWTDATAFSTYVSGLRASGSTYHDLGLIWGARLLSPTGIFSAQNALTPQGGEIERHLIFMTDGDTSTLNSNYGMYGYPAIDRRQTPADQNPTTAMLNEQVNLRFDALCLAVRNQNITLWVVSFGGGVNTATEDRLRACASSGRYFTASDSAALQATFKSIADQISALRLTR